MGNEITAALLDHNHDPHLALRFSNPLELLVATMLSAQCTDARVNAVTAKLFEKYKTAEDYANADLETLEQEIRPTGFYKNKARMLKACCRKLEADFGGRVPASMEQLHQLPGVGRKTANMVLGNAFGQQTIAVDTHVLRVSNRLGLVSIHDADKAEAALMGKVPRVQWTAFTNAMILHGREICTARRPRCGICVLFDRCQWPDKRRYLGGSG
ncbi:MAG TPA: endonuclease III [Methylococcaceae bacterium]|nr:endonuclease III [Methylococcaceae bacterium]